MSGQNGGVEYNLDNEEERWQAHQAFIAASQKLTAVIKQLNEAQIELRNDYKKLSDLFVAYSKRHDDLDAATVAANKRSRELDAVYEQLQEPSHDLH